MPWMECSPGPQREGLVTLLETQAVSFVDFRQRFGVSRKTGGTPGWDRFHRRGTISRASHCS